MPSPLKIEDMLAHIGSVEVPEDPVHRYELRRELLCSRYFEEHCVRQQRWNRLATFTAPLLTGGVLVVVFTLVGSSMVEMPSPTPTVHAPAAVAQIASTDEELKTQNEYMDTRESVPVYDVIKFVPVQAANYVFMR